ncbi:hypothetical protein H4R18_003279 [Coemansia javaensis]|uniref:Uncharacterized protein n=1 Tax=Coemansia javaensis TaxID=2761396 RepID=A0A9W8LHY4_9FUNG|nr:hypothetical protein H4R18_003279 [Coemansia javaensis]
MRFPTVALALASLGPLVARGHQGCNVEAALNTLMGKATVDHVSEALLQGMQRDVKGAIDRLEHTSPGELADRIVLRYRLLRGILTHVGVFLPSI